MNETKKCAGPCARELPDDDAHFPPGGHGKRRSACRECFNKRRRTLYGGTDLTKGPNLSAFEAGHFEQVHLDAVAQAEADQAELDTELQAIQDRRAGVTEPKVEVVEETITRVEEHRLKRRIKDLESELREVTEQLSEGGEYHEVIAEVLARQGEYKPTIEPRERTSGLREGTPLVLASDWHIEEEVRPEQVEHRNRYNLDISRRRMERFFEATRWGIDHQREVFKIRDLMMWFGGDLITNFLHEDNVESNLLHPTEAILMAQEEIVRGIDFLLEDPEIEQFVFPCNDGNHGRTTKKMRSATRTQNSLEVFLYAQLAMHYRNKGEKRVKFILPTSSFNSVHGVYHRTIRFLHGDVFKYGGGIGGIYVPMFRALGRWENTMHADLTCMGHWHQRVCLPNVMVNGSLIGFNSYAMDIGANFEPPVQSMRMLEPKRWCSTDIPLWVSDREDDEMAA
jgi:hypothetical protein